MTSFSVCCVQFSAAPLTVPKALCRQARAAGSTVALTGRSGDAGRPQRWLPVPLPATAASPSPRRGWQAIDIWKQRALEGTEERPVKGNDCSALMRTIRRAEDQPDTTLAFWKQVVSRGGQLAAYLSPGEVCEIAGSLANVKLRWQKDERSTRGLRKFADHVAEEIGAYSPRELTDFVWAMARLHFHHEDLMQALSRTVERIVRVERGRLTNEDVCKLLSAYQRFGLLDETVMRSLSRLICRRLVREPLEPKQTARVVAAYAGLRVRDVALFNATTLAFCRRGVVESLDWYDLAGVTAAYASSRLHSASLFARIRKRLLDSAGMADEEDAEHDGDVSDSLRTLREQLSEPSPVLPPVQLPVRVITLFLEANVHLGQLGAHELAPLLPHLAHADSATHGDATGGLVAKSPPPELAALLAVALGRGGHAWPWLWRRTLTAFGDERLPPREMIPLLGAMRSHLQRLEPLLFAAGGGTSLSDSGTREVSLPHVQSTKRGATGSEENSERAKGKARHVEDLGRRPWDKRPWENSRRGRPKSLGPPRHVALVKHLRSLSSGLAQLWGRLSLRCQALSDSELKQVTALLPVLVSAQDSACGVLERANDRGTGEPGADAAAPLLRVTHRCVRRVASELVIRRLQEDDDLERWLGQCGVASGDVGEDVRRLTHDAI